MKPAALYLSYCRKVLLLRTAETRAVLGLGDEDPSPESTSLSSLPLWVPVGIRIIVKLVTPTKKRLLVVGKTRHKEEMKGAQRTNYENYR